MNNPQLSVAGKNAALNSITALLNNGTVNYYTGTQPAGPDTALSGNTLLATDTFGSTAFATATGGTAAANAITSGTAGASGTTTFARLAGSGGSAVLDLACGGTATGTATLSGTAVASVTVSNGGAGYTSAPTVTFAASPSDILMATVAINAGNTVALSSLVLTHS